MAIFLNPSDVWAPFGVFSMAAVQDQGRMVYLKGQVALDRNGSVVGPGDMRIQTRTVLENIRTVLASVGGDMSDVVSLTQYVTDMAAFMRATDIRREFFDEPYPVTTTVQVAALYRPELVVEITAIAEIPMARLRIPQDSASR